VLDFAILGLLHEAPMHGYELRKRLHELLGAFRAFSYGTLYPTLGRLQRAGLIVEESPEEDVRAWGRRAKKVYKITAEGKERFTDLIAQAGPETYDDAGFGIHFAFFARTDQATRLRILEGRRRKVEERRESMRDVLARAGERLDAYTLELQRHGLDACEREVRWLEELIVNERSGRAPEGRGARQGTEGHRDPATETSPHVQDERP
jgi:DNA-binding PadR family transcriptional regulator